jgi:hypothetical protein
MDVFYLAGCLFCFRFFSLQPLPRIEEKKSFEEIAIHNEKNALE